MNVAQYIARYLAAKGVSRIFMLTGGGAMFLNDALSFEPGLTPVFCHHEQACAMAAEGYARIAGAPGVVNVTTGPGGINALNGVFGAYTDSIPMLVISGQVKRATHLRATPVPGLRQLGDQEVDIVAMATPVTKWAHGIFDPQEAPRAIAKAWALCQSGRPGPVWLDIPIDVQSSELSDEVCQQGLDGLFDRLDEEFNASWLYGEKLDEAARGIVDQIIAAKRPLMLWGTGVRLSGARDDLLAVAELLRCPVATGWTHDTLPSGHPLHAGRPGTIGTRAGNFSLQKSDLVVALGTRLNIRQTSYNFESFAKNAKLVHVDVDPAELDKPLVKPDEAICADLRWLAPLMLKYAQARASSIDHEKSSAWLAWIASRRERYPDVPPAVLAAPESHEGPINPYALVAELFAALPPKAIVATGNASACIMSFQSGRLKEGQRLFSNSGSASMGYDIPAAVGAACAAPERLVVALAGDGSAQMNIQELETIKRLRLGLKVIIFDNEGYLSIKSSQANFFKRFTGSGPDSGVGFPDFAAIARAYGIAAVKLEGANTPWRPALREALLTSGPMLIHAKVDPLQGFEPRMSSRKMPDGRIVSPELEDLHPFLNPEELSWAMGDEL
jgi:acetolactate synthase-1/2/3 large subunit